MIVGGPPGLVRFDRCSRRGTNLADVGHRAIRVNIERHAHCVGGALVELCAFHVLALPRIGWHETRQFECEVGHWQKIIPTASCQTCSVEGVCAASAKKSALTTVLD